MYLDTACPDYEPRPPQPWDRHRFSLVCDDGETWAAYDFDVPDCDPNVDPYHWGRGAGESFGCERPPVAYPWLGWVVGSWGGLDV